MTTLCIILGNRGVYYQPVAVLPQTPSPKKSSIPNGKNGGNGIPQNGGSNGSKPISPYIVSVNSPPSASPDHSPTSSGHITNSSGSNVSTGSSSSQSSNEGSIGTNGGSKYTRVPPPRYRPHQPPLAQRRPLSGGPYQHHHQQDQPGQRMNQSNSQGNETQQIQKVRNLFYFRVCSLRLNLSEHTLGAQASSTRCFF